ncbi:MAG TPA: AAA family ATPase [Spirochaetota bacterium]|nr:AAA family ATPase [Spirochaetota bacterium]
MINTLTIKNFKSIKSLDLQCKRINLFIGEPNTGKSNILEAFGLFNYFHNEWSKDLKQYVRFEHVHNLFYDGLIDEPIEINLNDKINSNGELTIKSSNSFFDVFLSDKKKPVCALNSNGVHEDRIIGKRSDILFYRYNRNTKISKDLPGRLDIPDGENLFMTAYSSKENREMIASLFRPYGLKAVFKPNEKTIEIQKQQDDIAFSYPYSMMSDTLLRIIFYMLAIKSNKDATLVFEEPEAHAFPYYTKQLGEVIAKDTSNQYFIATHNPYLLNAIVEQGKVEDVNIVAVYYSDFQTKVKELSTSDIESLLEQDPFLALDHFTGK